MMQRTLVEKITVYFARIIKKHRWTMPFFYFLTFLLLFVNRLVQYFAGNCKRYLAMILSVALFIGTSSFTFPIFNTLEIKNYEESEEALESDISFVLDEQISEVQEQLEEIEELEGIDEQAFRDEYEIAEYESIDLVDTVSLNELISQTSLLTLETQHETSDHFDKTDWRYLLVNKQHPIPKDYEFPLGKISGNMRCDERIIPELLDMMQAAQKDGVNLVICSPYRDMAQQEYLFRRKIDRYMGNGMSYLDAYRVASQAVTVPGASEHQIGLSLDIVCDSYFNLNAGFGETKAGKWLAEHSREYGFILRYPSGKEYITSIEYEPWHFRYVGKEAARVIMDEGITLEEFVDRL